MNVIELTGAALAILVLAVIGEAVVEYLIKDHLTWLLSKLGLVDQDIEHVRDLIGKYSAALVGVGLCFLYQVDIPGLFGLEAVWVPGTYLATGLFIGRGANYVHDFFSKYLKD